MTGLSAQARWPGVSGQTRSMAGQKPPMTDCPWGGEILTWIPLQGRLPVYTSSG